MTAIAYKAPPTVAEFMRSDVRRRAIVGPVGSGKSSGCCMELLKRAVQQEPYNGARRTRGVVVRNTYRELEDTTRKTFEKWIPQEPAFGRWYESDFMFVIDTPMADGTRLHCELLFRALDKPEHVKKLLSLELTFAYINEGREIQKTIFDALDSRLGRYPAVDDGGPTWRGMWMDSNPWTTGSWQYKAFNKDIQPGWALFEQPSGLSPKAENVEKLDQGYYENMLSGKDQAWVDEYVHAKYPSHTTGSVWGSLLAAVDARGGIHAFEHPTDDIFTVWDLGRADSTAIWFYRLRLGGLDVVDHYENHGQGLSHYFGVLERKQRERGYRYVKHWLPHDARSMTLATDVSVVNQFIRKYGTAAVEITPELSLLDGIAAARWLLEQDIRFHARCDVPPVAGLSSGLECLRSYHYERDEEAQTNKRTPVHDWSSHSADAFRYLAVVAKMSEDMIARPKPGQVWTPPGPHHMSHTLDELWRDNRRRG